MNGRALVFALFGAAACSLLTPLDDLRSDASVLDASDADADANAITDAQPEASDASDAGCVYAWLAGEPLPDWLVPFGSAAYHDAGIALTEGATFTAGAAFIHQAVLVSRFDLHAELAAMDAGGTLGDGLTIAFVRKDAVGGAGGDFGFFEGGVGGYALEMNVDPTQGFYAFASDDGGAIIGSKSPLPATFLTGTPHTVRVHCDDGALVRAGFDGVDTINAPLALGYQGYFGVTAGSGSYVMIANVTQLTISLPDLPACP